MRLAFLLMQIVDKDFLIVIWWLIVLIRIAVAIFHI